MNIVTEKILNTMNILCIVVFNVHETKLNNLKLLK
jgi:hypothetical protein